jgi:hypothetical protein
MKVEGTPLVRRPSGRGGWVSVSVEQLLTKWFENPKDNHGIVLHAVDEHGRQIVVTDHAEEGGALVSVQATGAFSLPERAVRRGGSSRLTHFLVSKPDDKSLEDRIGTFDRRDVG